MNEPELRTLLAAVQRGELSIDDALSELRRDPVPASAPPRALGSVTLKPPSPVSSSKPPKLSLEALEFSRIRALSEIFASSDEAIMTGIGDDGAVLRPPTGPLVLSVDVAVEGVHFQRAYLSFAEIGARSMSAAVSDLAAMGARPLAALCSLVAPSHLVHEDFMALHVGIAQAARDYKCPVVGGNLAGGDQLSLSTTVVGVLTGRGLYRNGARAGDNIYVTGPLGSAALGLKLLRLEAAMQAQGPAYIQAWRAPRARVAQGMALSSLATSAIDISDGTLADLGHICEASALGAVIEAGRLPLAAGMADIARSLGADPLELALNGGEDYELIYTLQPGAADPCGGTCIGHMLDAPGPVQVVNAQGKPLSIRPRGFQHFS
jgi:thiamine-monophosphate kinase